MMLTQFISPSPGMSAAQRKVLALVTALIFGFSLAKYASGLSLYWATGNLVNLLVQLVLNRSQLADQTTLPDSAISELIPRPPKTEGPLPTEAPLFPTPSLREAAAFVLAFADH